MMKRREQAKSIISELLRLMPSASCEMFHHKKADRHDIGEECLCVKRLQKKIARANRFISLTNKARSL